MPGSIRSQDGPIDDFASISKRNRKELLTEKLLDQHKDLYLQCTSLNGFFNSMGKDSVPPKVLMHWVNQHRLHARLGFVKLLGHSLAKVTTLEERHFPHEQNSLDLICEAVSTIHQLIDFLGHILLELEDENEIGLADISFSDVNHEATKDEIKSAEDQTNQLTPANWSSVDFLLAAAVDAPLPECLVIIWTLAQVYHDGWGLVKEKMVENGLFPSDEEKEHLDQNPAMSPRTLDRQLVAGLWGSDLTPAQKLVSHWTSHAFGNFTGRMATNVQGYVDIGILDEKVASKLFQRTLMLESKVWPQL